MKNIFIIHAHWNNRGDEAANRALIDELLLDKNNHLPLQINSNKLYEIENLEKQGVSVLHNRFPKMRDSLEVAMIYLTKGKICLTKQGKDFVCALKSSDIVVHAPGGPSIGDIYLNAEIPYLYRLLLAKRLGKPYFIYAPSMGPFQNKVRNVFRKYLLKNACSITLREAISASYLKQLIPDIRAEVTLDSAFQHPIDIDKNREILNSYSDLSNFISKHERLIGITITDLQWNPLYAGNLSIKNNIYNSFMDFITYLNEKGYGVVFIPQLFGAAHDYDYMKQFSSEHSYVMNDTYDCYFQQYIISKMMAVVGMRYHSNIFSCKMKTPFISVSYEQKMKGFMEKIECTNYCIDIKDLSADELINKFNNMLLHYREYKDLLSNINQSLIDESRKTTELLRSKL